MDVRVRNNVTITGRQGAPAIMFAHGFGCDQNMWRLVAPHFEGDYQVVLFDHVGLGASDIKAYDPAKYSNLSGYAEDLVEICEALGLTDVTFVGHSVSSTIGVLAANMAPDVFAKLVLVGPSPRYMNDEETGYIGGFSEEDIQELLETLSSNYLGWSSVMAPVIMGNGERPHLGAELTASFCRTDPDVSKGFARATFLSDNRKDFARVTQPTLVLQCANDPIASEVVGQYVADNIVNSTLVEMEATGHCPNLSAPEETTSAIKAFVSNKVTA